MSVPPVRIWRLIALLVAVAPAAADDAPAPPKRGTKFDKDRLYLYQVKDFTTLRIGGGERDVEHQAFCDVALHASGFTTAELLAAGRKDVSYSNLMAADDRLREDVRFELVRVDGRLKRLKRIGTFPELQRAGIEQVYEAWVFPTDKAEPVCVHLTDPPGGVEPADDITPAKAVRVAGYFFKVVAYRSSEPNPKQPDQSLIRRAPLLIGRGLEVTADPPAETPGIWVLTLLPAVLGWAGVLAILIFGLSVWYRRTDAGARKYTDRAKQNPFEQSPDEG
ncbi:MAG: hypothetical protein ABGY75_19110, partial [Gemmataceae bacterium]